MENLYLQPAAAGGKKENSNKSLKRPPSQSLLEDLPDEILHNILYFLNTKDAFRTSVLSKRWIPVCHSLDFFSINDGRLNSPDNRIQLLRFVNSVMFSPHSQHLPIETFILNFKFQLWNTDDHFTFNKWLEAAKRRRVCYLYLRLLNVPLAPSIFCFKTLISLSLVERSIGSFHSCVDLPLLTTLEINNVRFHDREDFLKLIFGSPLLETLNTVFVRASNESVTAGYYKPLSNLILSSICLFQVPLKAVYNVQTLGILELGRSVLNVETNSYYKDLPVFGNLTVLYLTWNVNAEIHEWDEVLKMLHNCPKLQSLSVYKEKSAPTKEDWKYPYHVPECLSSHLTKCKIKRYGPIEADFRFATYILQNAKHLKVMTIGALHPEPTESSHFVDDLLSCSRISPACKLSISNNISYRKNR